MIYRWLIFFSALPVMAATGTGRVSANSIAGGDSVVMGRESLSLRLMIPGTGERRLNRYDLFLAYIF